jgi:hypothetical protein
MEEYTMALLTAQLTLELIPHCASVTRDGWTSSHDVRPLAELGMKQAAALVAAAASHGDVIPVLLAALSSAFDIPRPQHVGRGGWYTLQFAHGNLAITEHDPARTDRRACGKPMLDSAARIPASSTPPVDALACAN